MYRPDQLAIETIIDIIYKQYGYDFRNYSRASLKRRLKQYQLKKQLDTLADMIPYLINQPDFFNELLSSLSVTVTEMFRDPEFYIAFEKKVLPKLRTYSYFSIWFAGCATGEEVYSMAILLYEHELLKRASLHGTDINPYSIKLAKKGIYPSHRFQLYAENYEHVTGNHHFEKYFVERYGAVKVKQFLQHNNVIFFEHNLATDSSFAEVEVIVCRNVLIYFDEKLKHRTINLFADALIDFGYLCLGDKEKINDSRFKCINRQASIYQKVPK